MRVTFRLSPGLTSWFSYLRFACGRRRRESVDVEDRVVGAERSHGVIGLPHDRSARAMSRREEVMKRAARRKITHIHEELRD